MYYLEESFSKEIDEECNESPIDINNTGGVAVIIPLKKSLTKGEIGKLGMKELKEELKSQEHPIIGKKADLCACLMESTSSR